MDTATAANAEISPNQIHRGQLRIFSISLTPSLREERQLHLTTRKPSALEARGCLPTLARRGLAENFEMEKVFSRTLFSY